MLNLKKKKRKKSNAILDMMYLKLWSEFKGGVVLIKKIILQIMVKHYFKFEKYLINLNK